DFLLVVDTQGLSLYGKEEGSVNRMSSELQDQSSQFQVPNEKSTARPGVIMRAFTSARYTVPLGHHSYPMDKYRLVPERLLTDGTLRQEELVEPEAATLDDVLRVHTPEYVHAFINGTLERKAMLRIGLPWSPALVQRAFAVIGGTLGAARLALEDG